MPQESFTVCIPLTKSSTLSLSDFSCYNPPTNLGESNVFTDVCQSFCPQGYLWSHVLSGWGGRGIGICGTKSFLGGISGTRSLRESFLRGRVLLDVCISMGWWLCPGGGIHTLDMGPGIQWFTVSKRVVRILLEWFLVWDIFWNVTTCARQSHLIHSVLFMVVKNTNVLHDIQYVQFFSMENWSHAHCITRLCTSESEWKVHPKAIRVLFEMHKNGK